MSFLFPFQWKTSVRSLLSFVIGYIDCIKMLFSTNNVISLYSAVLIASGAAGMQLDHVAHPRALFGGTKVRRQADPTCLANGALATGSALTGQEAGTEGIKAGQEASAK